MGESGKGGGGGESGIFQKICPGLHFLGQEQGHLLSAAGFQLFIAGYLCVGLCLDVFAC